jgi:hypothetical protein
VISVSVAREAFAFSFGTSVDIKMFWRVPRYFYPSLCCVSFIILIVIFEVSLNRSNLKGTIHEKIVTNEIVELVENPLMLANVKIYPEVKNYELKDWHDYAFMEEEARRVGPGENGTAVVLTDPEEVKISEELKKIEGLNVYVSDKISVNRSIPDVRHKK